MRWIAMTGLLGACFGDGPAPTTASRAQVVFTTFQDRCTNSYIGSVALGSGDRGFVALQPCSNAGFSDLPIVEFAKNGSRLAGTMIGIAGMSDTVERARVATLGAEAVWAFQSGGIEVEGAVTGVLQVAGSPLNPTGLVVDATTAFVAGWPPPNGSTDVANPTFPGGGNGQTPAGQPALGKIVAGSGTVIPGGLQPFACETMKDCLVANTTTLFFALHSNNSTNFFALPKTAGSSSETMTVGTIEVHDPVGLAVDDTRLVWAESFVKDEGGTDCEISRRDLATGTTDKVFTSTSFSCMDVALDDTAIYFTIVSIDEYGALHGDGIGRVSLADKTFESISLGIAGAGRGPRRLYLDGEDIYAVDPLSIARITKHALNGSTAFSP